MRSPTDRPYAERRAEYPEGSRVKLILFGPCCCDEPTHDDNTHVPPGTIGTVTDVDDGGTIHVHWDNKRNLGLITGLDKWEKI